MVQEVKFEDKNVEYTSVDLNATGTTTVYNPGKGSHVYFTKLENTGTSAKAQLEVTDGTDMAVLTTGQSAGDDVSYTDGIALGSSDSLEVNVTAAEGSDLAGTAAVSRGEQTHIA